MASLGGPHRYVRGRTGVGSYNSISFGVRRVGEDNAGNIATFELELTASADVRQSSRSILLHTIVAKTSPSSTAFHSEMTPLQSGANPKLNFLEAT